MKPENSKTSHPHKSLLNYIIGLQRPEKSNYLMDHIL